MCNPLSNQPPKGAGGWILLLLAALTLVPNPRPASADDNYLIVFNANNYPTRLCAGLNGEWIVSDYHAGSVFIYDFNLTVIGEIKQLNHPLGVLADRQGRILVGCGNGHLEVYDAQGARLGVISEGVLKQPTDLALDFEGNIYVADSRDDRVVVFDSAWNPVRTIGSSGSGDGQFNFPSCVAIAYRLGPTNTPIGELYVGDQGNARVQVFDLNGAYLRKFGSAIPDFGSNWSNRFNTLQSLVVDDLNRPHVLDIYLQRIQIFGAQTSVTVLAYGANGTAPGQMMMPLDLAMADDGRILAADAKHHGLTLVYSNAMTRVLLSANTVGEMAPTGTLVGVLSANPPPAGSNVFLFVPMPGGADNDLFVIEDNLLKTAAVLDRETQGICRIKIKAVNSNSCNLAYGESLTVLVGDSNDAPTGLHLDTPYVYENQPTNTVVGRFVAEDADTNDTFSYAFVSGTGDTDNALFSIAGDRLLTAAVFDHEATNARSIRVRIQDAAGALFTNALVVSILNVNELNDPDSDGDGMPDWWEQQTSGSSTGMAANADTDADGVNNLAEWLAATDPMDASAVLAINSIEEDQTVHNPMIKWASEGQRVYSVEWTSNLAAGVWSVMATNIAGTPPVNGYTDTVHAAQSAGYYRIKVSLPP